MRARRPATLAELPFPRHRPVRWFSPGELGRTGVRVLLSSVFGAYADKREVQASLPVPDFHDHSAGSELWLDYVSDVGDGFDATCSVAGLLARPKLDLAEADGLAVPTPRGAVLVMGGDEVYPTATSRAYEERTKGPYRAALPEADDPPTLYALPGNHDWYDGLTAWLRFFCQGSWVGGWRTVQRRSYFALRLPQGWWLLGLDVQLDTYLDGPQVDYFRRAAAHIGPHDGVVVCTGKPSWLRGGRDHPQEFATLDHFLTRVLGTDPRQVRLMLSGDLHHYARFAEAGGDRQLVTCGGGGAYLSATHGQEAPLLLPPAALHATEADPPVPARYELAAVYPSAARSRRLVHGVLHRLPRRNPGFVGLTLAVQAGLAHVLVDAAERGTAAAPGPRWSALALDADLLRAFRSPALLLGALLLLLVCRAAARSGGHRRPLLPASLHTAAHLGVTVGAVLLAGALPLPGDLAGPVDHAVRLALAAAVAGPASVLVVAAYLWLSALGGRHLGEVFSAQGLEDHKSFLRLHVGGDGVLTLHAVAVPRVARTWRVPTDEGPGTPWVEPAEPLAVHLVEPPVRIPREAT